MNRLFAFLFIISMCCNAWSASTVKIAMYGDSTMWGETLETGSITKSPNNEPAAIQSLAQTAFGSAVTVEDHSVPGSTCTENLYGQSPVTDAWASEMAHTDAQIIVMNCGINDAFVPGETDQDFIYLYSQMGSIAQAYGKTFIMMSPNPINVGQNVTMWSYANDEQYVSTQLGYPFVDQWNHIMATVPNWSAYLPDKIHPNSALYQYKANYSWTTAIEPWISWWLAH